MRLRIAVASSLALLPLAGCGGNPEPPDAASRVEALWSSRTPYVGDGSRVAALVHAVGLAPAGSAGISLQTAARPYGLTVELASRDQPLDATDLSDQATLLLGLVGNLDEVTVSAAGDDWSLDAAAASQDLGYDVKRLGRDQPTLERYLQRPSD